MKQFYRLLACVFLCALVNLRAWATDITVGYLKYSVSGNSAKVIGYVEEDLPKDLVIPETIEYNELTFNVTGITGSAFQRCNIIETLVVPKSVTSITDPYYNTETGAFSYCTNLKCVTLKAVSYIGSKAFFGCTHLKWIDFGNSLNNISKQAFNNCSSLTYLIFPPTINSITQYYSYNNPFIGCDFIQAAIYLGDKVVSTGLSNINTFTRKDFITWTTNNYTYTGKEIEPEYTNNLPFKFKPEEDILLEKNVGKYTKTGQITFSNNDMSFTVELPYEYTISPKTVTAHVKDATREYGESNPEFGVELTGFVSGEDQSVLTNTGIFSTNAKQNSEVGTYEITLSGMEAQNYVFQYESGTLTITKAPLTMAANDKTMNYGDNVPTLEVEYVGLKNNESKPVWITEPSITTTATSRSKVGDYPITISKGVPKNYNLTIKSGTLTIKKKGLKIKAQDVSRLYGDNNPELNLLYTGLVNDESEPEWIKTPTLTTIATKNSAVGDYIIEINNAEAVNYDVELINGKLSVTKALLTVSVGNYTIQQGGSMPEFEAIYSGFKNADAKDVLIMQPTITCSANDKSEPGEYEIVISGADSPNYEFCYKNGKLTIMAALAPGNTITDNGIIFEIKNDGTLDVIGLSAGTIIADILSEIKYYGKKYQVSSIGERAFEGRSDITYLSIPWSVISIGENAFKDCGSDMTVNIADPESWCKMELGNVYASPLSCAKKVLVHDIETDQIDIPDGVTSIENFTFYQCHSIKSLSIPSTVTYIGSSAFEDCTGLTSLTLNEGLESIGGSAFEGCSGLTSISIPSTVNVISINAFKNCKGIKDVFCFAEIVPDTDDIAFFGTATENSTLYVPSISIGCYKESSPWSFFKNVVALDKYLNALVEYIMEKNPESFNKRSADMNDDEKVNAADIVLFVNKMKGNNK